MYSPPSTCGGRGEDDQKTKPAAGEAAAALTPPAHARDRPRLRGAGAVEWGDRPVWAGPPAQPQKGETYRIVLRIAFGSARSPRDFSAETGLKTRQNLKVSSAEAEQTREPSGLWVRSKSRAPWPSRSMLFWSEGYRHRESWFLE